MRITLLLVAALLAAPSFANKVVKETALGQQNGTNTVWVTLTTNHERQSKSAVLATSDQHAVNQVNIHYGKDSIDRLVELRDALDKAIEHIESGE